MQGCLFSFTLFWFLFSFTLFPCTGLGNPCPCHSCDGSTDCAPVHGNCFFLSVATDSGQTFEALGGLDVGTFLYLNSFPESISRVFLMLSSQWVIHDAKELSVKRGCLFKAVSHSTLGRSGFYLVLLVTRMFSPLSIFPAVLWRVCAVCIPVQTSGLLLHPQACYAAGWCWRAPTTHPVCPDRECSSFNSHPSASCGQSSSQPLQ